MYIGTNTSLKPRSFSIHCFLLLYTSILDQCRLGVYVRCLKDINRIRLNFEFARQKYRSFWSMNYEHWRSLYSSFFFIQAIFFLVNLFFNGNFNEIIIYFAEYFFGIYFDCSPLLIFSFHTLLVKDILIVKNSAPLKWNIIER